MASGIGLIGPIGLRGTLRAVVVGAIRPMSPMPYEARWLGLGKRVGGGSPLAGRFLPA